MPTASASSPSASELHQAINLRLGLIGCPIATDSDEAAWTELAGPVFERHREMARLLTHRLPPVDQRIQHFLELYLADIGPARRLLRLPGAKHLTDVYLLALAVARQARLATFDRALDPTLLPGGPAAYHILS